MTPEMKDFLDKVKVALGKFESQEGEVKALKDLVEGLQRTWLETQEKLAGPDDLGFTTLGEAKDFMEYARCIFTADPAAKDLSEGIDPDGGFLVPGEFRPTLVRLVEAFGVVRPLATVIPMNRQELTLPKLTTGVLVFWVDEGKTIPQTQPKFGEVRLVAKKLAALVPVTSELLEDSSIAIANLLATLFAEAIAEEEDRVALTADPTSVPGDPFLGVLHNPDVITTVQAGGDDSFGDLDADYLADMSASLPASAMRGARWFMHRTVFNIVRKLKTVDGAYIFQQPAGAQPGTIWEIPYSLVDVMPSIVESAPDVPYVILGNMRHLYIGDRRQMSMAQSQHVGFAQDKIFLRVLQRQAMEVAVGNACSVLRTAT